MGLFGGSTKTTTNETFDTGPSSFQKPYLDQLFSGAQAAYSEAAGTPYYQGDTYANMSPEQKAALDKMRAFATGTGLESAEQISGIGKNLAGYSTKAGTTLDDYLKMLDGDASTEIMSEAGKYADNPWLSAMIDANSRDVTRNLTESILPSIDRGASMGGNINSSRAGIASGIAQRGAADRIADISATLRGEAYSKGLDLASAERKNRLDGYLGASNAYGDLGATGINALALGAKTGYDAFDSVNDSYALEQADEQGQLDADYQKWLGEDQRDFELLNRYGDVVAGNQWGQSGTSTSKSKTKKSGGVLGSVLGAASTIAGSAIAASDPRLKKLVRKIGEFVDGLGIYIWSYLWEPDEVRHIGVMADEVAEVRPYALASPIGPYLAVNYSKL